MNVRYDSCEIRSCRNNSGDGPVDLDIGEVILGTTWNVKGTKDESNGKYDKRKSKDKSSNRSDDGQTRHEESCQGHCSFCGSWDRKRARGWKRAAVEADRSLQNGHSKRSIAAITLVDDTDAATLNDSQLAHDEWGWIYMMISVYWYLWIATLTKTCVQ